jgi:hypothetical protein
MTRHITPEEARERAEHTERRIENENEYGSPYYHSLQRAKEAQEEWENGYE